MLSGLIQGMEQRGAWRVIRSAGPSSRICRLAGWKSASAGGRQLRVLYWAAAMALVQHIDLTKKERHTVHKPTRCHASDFIGTDDKRYLPVDTFGIYDRDFPEKISESIQFNESGAAELKALIEQTFPGLG